MFSFFRGTVSLTTNSFACISKKVIIKVDSREDRECFCETKYLHQYFYGSVLEKIWSKAETVIYERHLRTSIGMQANTIRGWSICAKQRKLSLKLLITVYCKYIFIGSEHLLYFWILIKSSLLHLYDTDCCFLWFVMICFEMFSSNYFNEKNERITL